MCIPPRPPRLGVPRVGSSQVWQRLEGKGLVGYRTPRPIPAHPGSPSSRTPEGFFSPVPSAQGRPSPRVPQPGSWASRNPAGQPGTSTGMLGTVSGAKSLRNGVAQMERECRAEASSLPSRLAEEGAGN